MTIQQQNIRPCFALETDTQGEDTITTIAGPSSNGVTTHLDERDNSVMLAVDGYDKDLSTGMDLTPASARRLIRDLSSVIERLDELESPEVERVARELAARPRLLGADLLMAAEDNDISAVSLTKAVAAQRGA